MSRRQAPMRVFAILEAKEEKVRWFGLGTYVGDEQPPALQMSVDNPKIELDYGEVVWGYQCWWSPEDQLALAEERFGPSENWEMVKPSEIFVVEEGEDAGVQPDPG